MVCRFASVVAIACALVGTAAGPAQGQFIPLLTFEVDEELDNMPTGGGALSAAGLDGAGYGVTEGAQALVFSGVSASGGQDFFNVTVGGGEPGESGNNFNAFVDTVAALKNGADVYLTFDMGYDASGLVDPNPGNGIPESGAGYFQPGIYLNSFLNFQELRWGNLLEGNIGGDFPILDAATAAGGAVLAVLDPIDLVNGDARGIARVAIPIGTTGNPKLLNIDTNTNTPANTFFAIGFHNQGGWSGTIDISFDNVGFAVPEPASLAVLGAGVLAMLRRRG